MADSYLLTVEKALTDLLSVEIAAVSGKVYRSNNLISRSTQLPVISILQAPDVDDVFSETASNSTRFDWKTYLVQGWVDSEDINNPVDEAHDLLAKTKKVLNQITLSNSDHYGLKSYNTINPNCGLIADAQVGIGIVRPPEEPISSTPYFWLVVRLKLIENALDPYALPSR